MEARVAKDPSGPTAPDAVPWPPPDPYWVGIPPPPPPEVFRFGGKRAWVPSPRIRWALGGASVGLLAAAILGSFVGPITVNTYGPEPAGYQFQFELLVVLTFAAALLLNGAFFRLSGGARFVPLFAGTAAIAAGVILGFGYWVQTGGTNAPCYPNCGVMAPYSTQGGELFGWGFVSIGIWVAAFIFDALQRRSPALSGAPPFPPWGPPGFAAPYPPPPLEGPALAALYQESLERTRSWSDVTARRIGVGLVTLAALFLVLGLSLVDDLLWPVNPSSPALRAIPWLALVLLGLASFVLVVGYYGRRRFLRMWQAVESGQAPPSSLLATPPEVALRRWMLERGRGAPNEAPPEARDRVYGTLTVIRFGRLLSEWNHQLLLSEYLVIGITGLLALGFLGFDLATSQPSPGPFLILVLGPLVFLPALGWRYLRSREELRGLDRRFAPVAGFEYGLEQSVRSRF